METTVEALTIEGAPILASANRRIVARWLDAMILGAIGGFILALIWAILFGISEELAENPFFNVLLTFIGMMLLDIPCTKVWGRTPGKFLLGIKVVSSTEPPISWSQASKRSVLLWVRGLCFGIPLLLLVTSAVAMRKVAKNGVSSWDTLSNTKVIRNVAA